MSLALLFPGQGTQLAGWPAWWETGHGAAPLAALDTALGPDWRARLADAAWATQNRVAQPLLTALCLAAWDAVRDRLPAPAVVAGYSVGELPAACVAGVFPFDQALALAGQRARLMDGAAGPVASGLMAVAGWPAAAWTALCAHYRLSPAIVLSEEDVLLGGRADDLAAARASLEAQGVRCTPLGVTIASHTPLLAGALPAWGQVLAAAPFTPPRCPVVCGASARAERRPDALRAALTDQIAHTVRWDRCMDAVAERGVHCVLEVGPGTTLARLWSRRHPDIPVRSLAEFQSPDGVEHWTQRYLNP